MSKTSLRAAKASRVTPSKDSLSQTTVPFLISGDEFLDDDPEPKLSSSARYLASIGKAEQLSLEKGTAKDVQPAPLISPEALISAMVSKRDAFEKKPQNKVIVKQFSTPQTGHEFSSIELAKLKRLNLSNLKLNTRTKGYLLCRIIAPAVRRVCVQLAIEDIEGHAQLVSLYNHPGTFGASPAELDTLFPIGMVLAIKSPFLKRADTAPSCVHLRIDAPVDVTLVESDSKLLSDVVWSTGERPNPLTVRTSDDWKAIGDSHFKATQFFAAVVAYSRSLKLDPSNHKVKMNRSLVHLRLENTAACLEDIEDLLSDPNLLLQDHIKTLMRKGLALYAEAKYTDAKDAFLECLKNGSNSSEARQYLKRCVSRLRETSTGNYNWDTLYKTAMTLGTRLDVAPFLGPIEMKEASNIKGRAVYATKPISIGQLLAVEKAFCCTFPEDLAKSYHPVISNVPNFTSQLAHLRQACMDKLTFNPQHHSTFLKQFSGNTDDIEKVARVEEFPNGPLAPAETFSLPHQPNLPEVQRIAAINSFVTWFPGEVSFDGIYNPDIFGRAIFPFCAGFDNECYANARWECWGDVIIVRASRAIKAGEEIKIGHGPPARYVARQEEMAALDAWTKGPKYCRCDFCNKARHRTNLNGVPSSLIYIPNLKVVDEWIRERLCGDIEKGDFHLAAKANHLLVTSLEDQPGDNRVSPERVCAVWYGARTARDYMLGKAKNPIFTLSTNRKTGKIQTDQTSGEAMTAIHTAGVALFSFGAEIKNWEAHGGPRHAWRFEDKSDPIRIKTERLPYLDAGLVCLVLAEAYNFFNLSEEVDKWMQTALWLEEKTRGGGIPMFRLRYAKVKKSMGQFAEESLSRVERGKPFRGSNYEILEACGSTVLETFAAQTMASFGPNA